MQASVQSVPNKKQTKPSQEVGFWQDHKAIIQLLAYSVTLIMACVAVCYFILRDNNEAHYKAQSDVQEKIKVEMETIQSQLQARIDFLQNENGQLYSKNNIYVELLRSIPGTYEWYEAENERLITENNTLVQEINNLKLAPSDADDPVNPRYIKSYSNLKLNNATYDTSGIVVAANEIYVSNSIDIVYSTPDGKMYIIYGESTGYSKTININNIRYQLIIDSVNYISSTYGFTIRRIPE